MSEHSIATAKASVMLYNNETKKWEASGGSQGMSKIQVYHHPVNNTYRIVGRKLADHSVVINCALARGLKYNQATPTFHQWRDQRQVYGLNFSSRDDAELFAEAVKKSLETLSSVTQQSSAPQQQPQQQMYRGPPQQQNYKSHYQQHNEIISNGQDNEHEEPAYSQIRQTRPSQPEYEAQDQYQRSHSLASNQDRAARPHYDMHADTESESGSASQISISSISSTGPTPPTHTQAPVAPAAPPTPPVAPAPPPAPTAPPVPPAPPMGGGPPAPPGGGGPPAPPPPPPGPPIGGGGGSLADQIAAAKLKKAKNEAETRTERSGSTSRSGVGSFGKGDVMAEMARKLAARRAKEDADTGNAGSTLQSQMPTRDEPDARQERLLSTSRVNNGTTSPSNKTNFTPATKTNTNNLKIERANNSSRSDTSSYSEEIEQLKNDLLADFKRELDIAKREIIEAMRQEIARLR